MIEATSKRSAQSRLAFEAHVAGDQSTGSLVLERNDNGDYVDRNVHASWELWQAATKWAAREWRSPETAPTKVRHKRVLVLLQGNDKWDRRLRTMPGYFDDDGQAIAMDETGHFPFVARRWKPFEADV